jgi:ComF family protein
MKNEILGKILSAAAGSLLPSACTICGKNYALFPAAVCGTCRDSLSTCIREFYYHADSPAKTLSLCSYGGLGGLFVRRIKYGGKRTLLNEFFNGRQHMIRTYLNSERIGVIIPVPLSPLKLLARGFNQSELIASAVSEISGLPVIKNLLRRRAGSAPQVKMSRSGRAKNVKGAFIIRGAGRINGENILLTDDVVTTGSTLKECAELLMEHGAGSVNAFTLAKTF